MFNTPQDSLKALGDHSPLAIICADHEGKINVWNPAAERMCGWRKDEVLGQGNPIILPEGQSEYQNDMQQIFQGSPSVGKELLVACKDGHMLEVRAWPAPVQKETGAITGIAA